MIASTFMPSSKEHTDTPMRAGDSTSSCSQECDCSLLVAKYNVKSHGIANFRGMKVSCTASYIVFAVFIVFADFLVYFADSNALAAAMRCLATLMSWCPSGNDNCSLVCIYKPGGDMKRDHTL